MASDYVKRCLLSSLTAIFGSSEEKNHDSDKLMDLYWNRAELKKEFAGMRKEKYRLLDRIKQQEGATARLQQKLDHLESLLVDPEWAHNVVVYYQLRGIGHRCERKLARFAEQLKLQREQKSHDTVLVGWNDRRKQEARDIASGKLEICDRLRQLEDELHAEQQRLTCMNAFVRLFRGRSSMKHIDAMANDIEVTLQKQQELDARLQEVENREPPEHQGLDIAAKRSINLMIIAFAQQLYLHFADDDIAALIKEATEKSVGAINYGTAFDCEQFLAKIRKSVGKMESATDFANSLQKRARLISESAKFNSDADAVPLAGSVGVLYDIDKRGSVQQSKLDITGTNYWAISKSFSR